MLLKQQNKNNKKESLFVILFHIHHVVYHLHLYERNSTNQKQAAKPMFLSSHFTIKSKKRVLKKLAYSTTHKEDNGRNLKIER